MWTEIEDLQNIGLNALPVYDNRYIKTKIRTYGVKVYTNFRDLNVPEDGVEFKPFTIISIGSLLVYENKYYLQVYLDSFPCENCKHTNDRLSWRQFFWVWLGLDDWVF